MIGNKVWPSNLLQGKASEAQTEAVLIGIFSFYLKFNRLILLFKAIIVLFFLDTYCFRIIEIIPMEIFK